MTYYYDADGLRMEKSSGTKYWPGPSGNLTEASLSGTIGEEYIFFNGARIARVDRPSGIVHYYFSDKLESASVITDTLGNITRQDYYFPYGGEISTSTGSDPNHYKFAGKERDTESGLDEFGARYYTSNIGRFMTPDWSARATARCPVPQVRVRSLDANLGQAKIRGTFPLSSRSRPVHSDSITTISGQEKFGRLR